ncbi:MAG: hypothetical protein HY531_02825 [Chloroflexi bacterium]|nr:hypothetical protein [Chloroflexota bacterium]
MDKISSQEDAERFLRGLGLTVAETVVCRVVRVLRGEDESSMRLLWYGNKGKRVSPICGKGTVSKIRDFYNTGKLQQYVAYLDARAKVLPASDTAPSLGLTASHGAQERNETISPQRQESPEAWSDGMLAAAPRSDLPRNPQDDSSLVAVPQKYQTKHIDELIAFGQLLRDKLSPIRQELVWRSKPQVNSRLWWRGRRAALDTPEQSVEARDVEKDWGRDQYDARSHPLFAPFQNHVGKEHPCWSILSDLQAAYRSFCTGCEQARARTLRELEKGWSEIGVQIPENAMAVVAGDALSRIPRSGLVESAPQKFTVDGHEGDWRLIKGTTTIASGSRRDSLERLKEEVAAVDAALPSTVEFKELAITYQQVQDLIAKFREHLIPDARLRHLVLRGRCEFCTSS